MKQKIKTPQNYKPTKGEVNNSPSLTQPGMDMNIRETVRRLQMGQPVPQSQQWLWDDLEDFDEFVDMRISDITDLDSAQQFVNDTLDKFKKVQESLTNAKKEADEKDKKEKEIKANALKAENE